MNELQVFKNDNFSVRTVNEDGEIWFVAKDVAMALGYSEWRSNLIQSVPEIWKEAKRISSRSKNGVEQEREILCLSEQGLYFFLGRSDKPKALPYQMWIAGEVMPSLRRTGSYGRNLEMNIRAVNFCFRSLTDTQEERERINQA